MGAPRKQIPEPVPEPLGPEARSLLSQWLNLALDKGLVYEKDELWERTLRLLFPRRKIAAAKKGGIRAIRKLLHDTAG
jgi:hypothetical protein